MSQTESHGGKSEVLLLGFWRDKKSVVGGWTEETASAWLSQQQHHETVLSPLLFLRDSMPAKYKEYLLVQGWAWFSILDMAWMFSLHNTDCQPQQILARSSAFPTANSSLPSNTARTCTFLSSLGFSLFLLFSSHTSALATHTVILTSHCQSLRDKPPVVFLISNKCNKDLRKRWALWPIIYPICKFSKHLLGSYLSNQYRVHFCRLLLWSVQKVHSDRGSIWAISNLPCLSNSNLEQSECPLMSVKSYWLTSVNSYDFNPISSIAENKTMSYTAYPGIHASKFLYLRNRFLKSVGYRGKLLHDANWNFTIGEIPK